MENCEEGICAEDFKVPLKNIVKENEESEEKIWTKETKIGPGKINWRALAVEFTWKNIWTSREWKEIGKHFLFSFFTGFLFSALDVGTDGWSGFTFIFGTDYIKNVAGSDDTSVANKNACKYIGRFVIVAENGSESVEYYQYRCFEKDSVWGSMTLAFMFIPGLWGSFIWFGLAEQFNLCLFATLYILSLPLFPLVVIGTKLLGLINPGPEMKKLLAIVTSMEGKYESTMQFGLQLFIVMSRKDRMPSNLQWVTLLTSFLMLNKTGIESYLMYDKPSQDIKKTVQKIAGLLPMFLTATAFKLVSGALLCVIFSWWIIPVYIIMCCSGWGVVICHVKDRRLRHLYKVGLGLHPIALSRVQPKVKVLKDFDELMELKGKKYTFTGRERMQQLFFANLGWFVGTSIFLITAIIMALTCPNTSFPTLGFSNENGTTALAKYYKLSDSAIVSEDGPTTGFKILLPVLLACGLTSLGLIYWELIRTKDDTDDDEEDQEEPTDDCQDESAMELE